MHLNDLFEAVRPSILYHCTYPDNAAKIIHSDVVLANTEHGVHMPYGRQRPGFRPDEVNTYGKARGVSLSRSPLFTRRWGSGEGVVLAFDGEKLRRDFRLEAVSYYSAPDKIRSEAEEFLIGELKPVKRYLTAVIVSRATYDALVEENENFIPGHEPYAEITEHPLLRIEGDAWDSMTGKII